MALKVRTTIYSVTHAKTQYLTLSSVLTQDSAYPFKVGEQVEISIVKGELRIRRCERE